MSKQESDVVRRIAERDGITEDEAATKLAREGLARRTRKKTGKGQAKIYGLKQR